jgi:hypothetical protein
MPRKPHSIGTIFSAPLGPFSALTDDEKAAAAPGTVPADVTLAWDSLRIALGSSAVTNLRNANATARRLRRTVG